MSLARYLDLERRMIALDDAGDEAAAEAVRDEMDDVWNALTPEERDELDRRPLPQA